MPKSNETAQYTFANTLQGDVIEAESVAYIQTSVPWRRHVRIVKPGRNSHRRAGQVYLQQAEGVGDE